MFKFLVWHVLLLGVSCDLYDHGLGYREEYAPTYDNYKPRDYHFNYFVSDPHTGDHKSQWEVKENGVVRGAYSLLEPDGTTRVVEYIADHDGFRAVVKKIGTAIHPEPVVVEPEPIHYKTYDGHIYNYANSIPALYQVENHPAIGVEEHKPIPAVPLETHYPQLQAIAVEEHKPVPAVPLETHYTQPQIYEEKLAVPLTQHQIKPVLAPIPERYGGIVEGQHLEAARPVLSVPVPQHYGGIYRPELSIPIRGLEQYSRVETVPLHWAPAEEKVEEVPHYIQRLLQLEGVEKVETVPLHLERVEEVPHYVEKVPEQHYVERVETVPIKRVEEVPQYVEHVPRVENEVDHQVPLLPVSPSYTTSITYGLTGNPEDDSKYTQDDTPREKYHASYSEKVQKVVPAPDRKRESPAKPQFLIYIPESNPKN